jgi:hypothetical protein
VRQRLPAIRSVTGTTGAANASFMITIGRHTTGTNVLPQASRKPGMRKRIQRRKATLFKAMLFRGCFAALGFASAMAVATPTPSLGQGVYLQGPGFGVDIGRPAYRERSYRGDRDVNRSYATEKVRRVPDRHHRA